MKKSRTCAGFTMIEAIVSVLIVGLMLVAAMTTLGAVGTSRLMLVEQRRGLALAESMLAEIVDLGYQDPSGPGSLGPGAEEVSDGNRDDYDDVDDYHGWRASPPQERDGTPIADTTGWTRDVTVAWVNPDNLVQTSLVETGAKRITVTVKRGGKTVATLTAIRTQGRP